MKYTLLVLLFSVTVLGRITDNQTRFKIEKSEISITTNKGFHLNAEAPAKASYDNKKQTQAPEIKKNEKFVFKKPENALSAELSFYVCDDSKTVCEQHKKNINLKSGEVKQEKTKANYNSIKEISLKSSNGKPTLLVFSAPWCPACVRMQTETYPKPEVQTQLKKLNFVKLNSDVADNYELSEKFNIKAIPTIILLDKDGNETFRWLDFFEAASFAKELKKELQKVDSAEQLLKNAQLGDSDAASTLAFKAYNALNFKEAAKWFSLAKTEKDVKYKLSAEVNAARDAIDEDKKSVLEYLNVLQKAVTLTTSKLDRMRWTIDYLEQKKETAKLQDEAVVKAKAIVKEIDDLLKNNKKSEESFLKSTYGNYSGFEKIELLWLKAKVYGLLEEHEQKKKTNTASIQALLNKKVSVERPGEMLLVIAYLREAGESKKVSEYYERLVKKYPDTYVYFEKYARFAEKNKNFEKALYLAEEALKFPEGNEPQLVLLKTQILKELNKKNEALAEIEKLLKADYVKHKRFSRTLKKLNDLKSELVKLK